MLSTISDLQYWPGYRRGRSDAAFERSHEPMRRAIDGKEALLLASTEVRERRNQQKHDSQAAYARKRLAAIEAEWAQDADRVRGSVVLPLLYLAFALICVVAEGIFLAPLLDGLGVANRDQQLGLAIVMVGMAAILVELGAHKARGTDPVGRVIGWMGCLMAAGFAAALAWWRFAQLQVEAGRDPKFAALLEAEPDAAQAVVILLGCMLPSVAALALHYSLPRLRAAWLTARYWRLQRWAMRAERRSQMSGERLPLKLAQVKAAAAKARRDYDAGYEAGQGVRPMTTPQKIIATGAAVATYLITMVACREVALQTGADDGGLLLVVFVPLASAAIVVGALMVKWGVGWTSRKRLATAAGVRNAA